MVVAAEPLEREGHLEYVDGEQQRDEEDVERQVLFLHDDAVQDA